MVGAIPAVGRGAGSGRWASSALVYLMASTLAGAIFGALIGLLALPLANIVAPRDRLLVWAILTAALGLSELGIVSLPRPQRATQVPEGWRRKFPAEVSSALYGAVLGVGVLTPIPFVAFYALLAWGLLSGNPLQAAAAFALFGLVRAAPVALLSPFLTSYQVSFQVVRKIDPLYGSISRATGIVMLGLVAAVLLEVVG
jgi:hypothetical protein